MAHDDLFERLVGRWDLSGTMGETKLHHSVAAAWVLNDSFLQVHTIDLNRAQGGDPYEAFYYIGWDHEERQYVMHLLDTFGAGFSGTLGFGVREGNTVTFRFNYDDGPLDNQFSYDPGDDTWQMTLNVSDEEEGRKNFATKKLRRVNEDRR